MALSEEEIRKYSGRLMAAKLRMLCTNGFYGLLLSHMRFSIDEGCDTAYTDGERIAFSPVFLTELSDGELDFVLMHEVLHVALRHCFRLPDGDREIFNIACDIVVDSNIMKSLGMDKTKITLKKYGEAMHIAPDGEEGYLYTAEEVYYMLISQAKKLMRKSDNGDDDGSDIGDSASDENGSSGRKKGSGKGAKASKAKGKADKKAEKTEKDAGEGFDDHGKWGKHSGDGSAGDVWIQRVRDAAEAAKIMNSSNGRGTVPECVERLLGELNRPQLDWRTVLNDFVHEDVVDYSFMPPDRRFSDFDFFLPDLNEKDESVENILFMIDTSGSVSDSMIVDAYSEIAGAIDQFDGKLKGMLGFFDAEIYPPISFDSVSDLKKIRPKGGGGTRFDIIFRYVRENMQEKPPASIVILTDGYCPFPEESEADGIPTLWLINNSAITPPWGQVARIENQQGNGI